MELNVGDRVMVTQVSLRRLVRAVLGSVRRLHADVGEADVRLLEEVDDEEGAHYRVWTTVPVLVESLERCPDSTARGQGVADGLRSSRPLP